MVNRGKVTRSGVVSLFDVRVGTNERDVIVITPSELESAPTLVKGTVVLSLNDSLTVKSITLRMYGVAQVAYYLVRDFRADVSWMDPLASRGTPPTRASQKQTRTVFEKEWSFLPQSQGTFTLKQGTAVEIAQSINNKGNYEYPFEVLLPDDIPDSVEGLPGGAIIYKMKAIIERSGLVNKNIICRKHIRIVRTMSPTSFEFLQSQSIENLWQNKCQYTIEIPTTAHIIGSQIPFHIHMIPHLKGLSICRLDIELKEHYVLCVLDSKNAVVAEKKQERTVKSITCDARPTGDDDWNIHGYIEVPNSLDRCQASVPPNPKFLFFNNSVKFIVGLRNPDGHVSEIRASLPAALVLPPHISSAGTTPNLEDSTVNHLSALEANGDTLPSYESRIYDRLWDGVSYANIDTSALNTPTTMSRRASAENLRELNRVGMPNPGELEAGLRQALRERNEDGRLEETNHNRSSENLGLSTSPASAVRHQHPNQVAGMTPLNGDEDHPRLTPTSSPEALHISRTPSEGSLNTNPPTAEEPIVSTPLDMGRLSRVPSYNTANSSNILNLDPISQTLPTYASAMSSLPPIPESRSRSGSSATLNSLADQRIQRPSLAVPRGSPATDIRRSGPRHGPQVSSAYATPQTFDDPMRRISLMRHMFSSR